MRILNRRRPRRHLDIRRLHVLLRLGRANFLVRFGVCFLAVARAVGNAFTRDAGFEERGFFGVGLGFGAFCAGWWWG